MARRHPLVAVTSLTRAGVEACTDFLESISTKFDEFWLPLPREMCEGKPADLGPLEGYLEPLLGLYHEIKARWRCYESVESLKRREVAAVKLAALVIKAKVFERVELREWDGVFPRAAESPPAPSLVFGVPPSGDVTICGTYPPNPLEVASDIWHRLTPEGKLTLVRWIVRYIEQVVSSVNLDEAHYKVLRLGWGDAYRSLLR
ncbi:MAG: hypothetical protein LM577_01700 [Thermoproteaceae archaeon]|nr:hypothetical protein [Thermoproteaceae archaeon]